MSRRAQAVQWMPILSVAFADKNHIDTSAYVSALEAEIDRLVYQLYELSEEEIAIVEGRK